jgi:GMP synthase-like glutamine amidotransferase
VKPLLVVRHQEKVPLGIIEDVLTDERIGWTHFDCWEGGDLPSLDDVSGVIILGGTMNVDQIDDYPYLKPLREFTREAIDSGVPVLGSCLGAQVMTRALGGDVYRLQTKEARFVNVHATTAGLMDPVVSPFTPTSSVLLFHEDACALPEGATLLFEDEGSGVPAFRIGKRAYAIQFHFEVTDSIIAGWCDDIPELEAVWGITKDDLLTQAKEHLAAQQRAGRETTRRFLKLLD